MRRAFSCTLGLLLLAGCSPAGDADETAMEDMAMPGENTAAEVSGPIAPPTTDDEMIASAMSAAPRAVAENATIIAIDSAGQTRTLRQGTGAFTCIPDGPSPGLDPLCMDANGMLWLNALLSQQPPPDGIVGFAYMLAGGSDASITDPYAAAPPAGSEWIDTGPHVMLLTDDLEGYPTTHDDITRPYIMWAGTPYAHLMAPVE